MAKKKVELKFFSPLSFVAVFGSGIRDPGSAIRDPQSGMDKIRIRDKHPGSATLLSWELYRVMKEVRGVVGHHLNIFFLLMICSLSKVRGLLSRCCSMAEGTNKSSGCIQKEVLKTSVSDPDWIRIKSDQWIGIRIHEGYTKTDFF
jgi:hypothetical protein